MRRRIEDHLDRLCAYAISLTGEAATAEDLVQETVLRALSAKQPPAELSGLRPWLFRILRNAFIDLLRREGRMELLDQEALAEEIDERAQAPSRADILVDEITVRIALTELAPGQRDILNLIDVQGFSYAEAAEVLDVPQGTVMSRISRARQALLRHVADSNVTPLRRAKARGG